MRGRRGGSLGVKRSSSNRVVAALDSRGRVTKPGRGSRVHSAPVFKSPRNGFVHVKRRAAQLTTGKKNSSRVSRLVSASSVSEGLLTMRPCSVVLERSALATERASIVMKCTVVVKRLDPAAHASKLAEVRASSASRVNGLSMTDAQRISRRRYSNKRQEAARPRDLSYSDDDDDDDHLQTSPNNNTDDIPLQSQVADGRNVSTRCSSERDSSDECK